MVSMDNLPGTIAMAWGRQRQLPEDRFLRIGRTGTFPLQLLLVARAAARHGPKGLEAGNGDTLFSAQMN
jgi:hypothetical protein